MRFGMVLEFLITGLFEEVLLAHEMYVGVVHQSEKRLSDGLGACPVADLVV